MKHRKLKMFVWEDVLTDYSSGMMCALAYSPDHARRLLKKQCSYLPEHDLASQPKIVSSPAAFYCWGGG